MHDLAVLYEHPEWQRPLFAALDARGVDYVAIDAKRAAFRSDSEVPARVVFNQASPSAYVRGNTRAVPFVLAYLRHLEQLGCDVINGSAAFALELSKAAQVALCRRLGIDHPRSVVLNDAEAGIAAVDGDWPRLLKPDLGGSGARIEVVDGPDALRRALAVEGIWEPDHLFLLQELLAHDPERGIVRLELLEGQLLYPMRVVTHGRFNLCPSPVCNPVDGEGGACEIAAPDAKPVEFYPYPEVPDEAVHSARRILEAASIDVGAVEYLETPDGRRVFYDVNANSNLRPSVAEAFGVSPFERVVDMLVGRIQRAAG
ncbi:MAG: hypothetical protein CMN30_22125 [Sandaracinus sp.]|nr:hypothetical protein [Sandaracinus sp.]